MIELLTRDRRGSRPRHEHRPDQLVRAELESAQRQLATAREGLIAARRRVVELETAAANWTEMHRAAAAISRLDPAGTARTRHVRNH